MTPAPHTPTSAPELSSMPWTDGIAIVGMSARFPGARNIDIFWQRLVAGDLLISDLTSDELRRSGVDEQTLSNPDYVRKGTAIEDAEYLDAELFGLSPREAEIIDPQQRVFLESAWEALEHAGYTGDYDSIGIFGGVGLNTYLFQLITNSAVLANAGFYQLMLANEKDFVATRAAFKLNLRGPAVTVQTACSTSLAAVHLACQSLLASECDLALAGGVAISFPQNTGYMYMPGMILSRDGLCRPFDAQAGGTVPSRGAGMVVLKRLSHAMRDNDTIYAVIRGSAWNNDGANKAGYTVPSVEGQGAVIREALRAAGIDAGRIGFVETHGTATELGDPIEFAALTEVFSAARAAPASCLLGAIKSNLGHADVASGVAGLLKATLAVHHGLIPPTLHFEQPNPFIPFLGSPFNINRVASPWQKIGERWAGVSSFGIGGTNVHVVLSNPPQQQPPASSAVELRVFPLSARSATALTATTQRLADRLVTEPSPRSDEVATTLQLGRRRMAFRRAEVASSISDLAQQLLIPARTEAAVPLDLSRDTVFLFRGQGQNFFGAARGLFARDAVFRATLEDGAALLQKALGRDVLPLLIETGGGAAGTIEDTALAQPLLFLLEYALAGRWRSLGLRPAALLGHSLGELTAAAIAGVFRFEDGLHLAVERGRLMALSPEGRMLAVSLPASRLAPLLVDDVWLAADNSPRLSVASGLPKAIEAFEQRLRADRIAHIRLATRHAFHTPLMAEAARAFRQAVEATERRDPEIPWLSNVTGTWINAAEARSPQYWANQVLSRVRFSQNVAALADRPHLLLEVGPGEALLGMARPQLRGSVFLSTLNDTATPSDDNAVFLRAVARAWECGVEIDWRALEPNGRRRRVALPTYPFERQRYWTGTVLPSASLDPPGSQQSTAHLPAQPAEEVKRDDIASWFSTPFWRSSPHLATATNFTGSRWLVLHDESPLSEALVVGLREGGAIVITVRHAARFSATEHSVALDPRDRTDWERLCTELPDDAPQRTKVLDLWSRSGPGYSGYDALVSLLQAAGRKRLRFEQIDVITEGLQSILGEKVQHIQRAELIGLLRTIPVEYSNTRCRLIDMEPTHATAAEAALVLSELQSLPDATEVAYRGGRRWLHGFAPMRLPPTSRDPFRHRGTYFITGGLGGIGHGFARFLLQRYNARVLLIGRTSLSSGDQADGRRLERFASLQNLGGEVRYFAADVTDHGVMAQAVAYAHEELGPIHGVLHAAGLPGGSLIASQDLEEAREVRRSKVEGSLALAEALRDEKLDFLVLCSSLTAVAPGPGQAAYAAANAFQDAFAGFCRDELGLPAVSIGFDAWQEAGMAFDMVLPAGLESLKQDRLRTAMTTHEGIEVIRRVLASYSDSHITASALPLDLLISRLSTPLPATLTRADQAVTGSTELGAILDIWRDLLGNTDITANDNFFELGGHSLLGTMVIARIRQRFGVVLSLRTLFEAPTPLLLAAVLQSASPTEETDRSHPGELEGDREEFEI
jgi:phthiocerol/phenolphthiocerol synthesis type-I polyketide synthase E